VYPDKIGILLEVLFNIGSKWQWIGWMFGLRSEPERLGSKLFLGRWPIHAECR